MLAAVVALSGAGKPSQLLPESRATLLAAAQAQQAPELVGVTDYDNTPPVTLAGLRGKVVLVDFWTYTCINCLRTFPFLRALQKAYSSSGLVVLGVHSPEFDFEKSHANVAKAVQRLGVTWPVAEDPEMATWSAFGNQYWPANYLLDRSGKVRFFHAGEGDEATIEDAVRALLAEGGTAPAARIGELPAAEKPAGAGSDLTPETYFGAQRGGRYVSGGRTVSPGVVQTRTDPAQARDLLALTGRFRGESEALQVLAGASVTQRFRARDVYLTATPLKEPVVVEVTLDGQPVPVGRRGRSLVEEGGRTVVHVTADDLYSLITGPAIAEGVLRITARTDALRVFTATYGA